ncbi:MAG: EAL domain-containing protein [Steroidobacteraceae bacterium]
MIRGLVSQARKSETTAAEPLSTAVPAAMPTRRDLGTEATAWLDKLTHTLPHARLQALALYDGRGEVLASSAAHLAIDCRDALTDVLDAFVLSTSLESRFVTCEGGAGAVLLAIRDPDQALRGIALLASDSIDASEEDPAVRFLTPSVRKLLATIGVALAEAHVAAVIAPPPAAAPEREVSLDEVYSQIRDQEMVLYVQQLVRLRTAEASRRFEILLRHRAEGTEHAPGQLLQTANDHGLTSMIDRRVIGQLVTWLHRNPVVWKRDAPTFSVNLSATALCEAHFLSFVETCIKKANLPPALIGFEVDESVCRSHPEEVAKACEIFVRVGAPVTLDNLTMSGIDLPIMQSSAVRLVKIDPALTSSALDDRLSQAKTVGLVQTVKVMGLQTAAKRVDSGDLHTWLAALGVDFIQSFKTAPLKPLQELLPGGGV